MSEKTKICIGIDLGTTNSEVAVVTKEGRPVVIKVDNGKMVPSVVSVDGDGNILVGKAAVNNELAAPENTVRAIKRKMGRDELVHLGEKAYTPQMISSLILMRLKQAAEAFLGCPVDQAVITVPAFFTEKQRDATKEAAELAGLELLRLINEPTAAALAYALGSAKKERCLVYDLGGGTFDVSIVDFSDQFMEVKASHGDSELGGTDFDSLIAEKARKAFLDEHGIDLALNPLTWVRLMRAAEAAKIRLSTEASAEILEEFIAKTSEGKAIHLKFQIFRPEFEEMLRPTIQRSLNSVQKALEMASITAADLDRVVLVGGSTYIPLVKELLQELLQVVPQASINPGLVVAMGAAIEAAKLSGQNIGPMMVDVTPHSLGIECRSSSEMINSILIHRNATLPSIASRLYYKMYSGQRAVEIKVYQGESAKPQHNQLLGTFRLEELTESADEIHVKFELDRSGLLHVTATEVATGKKMTETLKQASRSRIKHANLADLENVRIVTESVVLGDGYEDDDCADDEGGNEEEGEFTGSFETIDVMDLEDLKSVLSPADEMVTKAQALLDSQTLDPSDQSDLASELQMVKDGDLEAVERLKNLLYYLA